MKRLRLLGLSHHTARLEQREQLAFSAGELPEALRRLRATLGESTQCVLLGTCNRVELYVASEKANQAPGLLAALCAARGVEPSRLAAGTYSATGEDVVRQLFRVAGALDSLVPGEQQILGQVRSAYEASREAGAGGPLLHGLFQRAVAVGKEIQRSTTLSAGRLSIGSVAVGYAEEIFDHLEDKAVLCIGAGKMTRLVLERLRTRAMPRRLTVCNRNPTKARQFAATFGGTGAGLEALEDELARADIVITGTGSREPILTAALVEPVLRRRRYQPLFIIDIAVPRDVEPAVGKLTNVYLYDVDDLQSAVERTLEGRREAMGEAEVIVERHVQSYIAWHRGRDVGPTIDRLYRFAHELAEQEARRTLRKLGTSDEAQQAAIAEMSRRIVNKLLHAPVSKLRQTPDDARHGLAYNHAVEQLFDLNSPEPETDDADPA
jgi:glutamyl-tRNA reductase